MTIDLALGTHHDLVLGDLKIGHRHNLFVVARGVQSRFVDDVRKIGTGKSGRAAGDDADIDAFVKRDLACVNLQDAFAAANVRPADDNASVKSSRAKQAPDRERPAGWSRPSG